MVNRSVAVPPIDNLDEFESPKDPAGAQDVCSRLDWHQLETSLAQPHESNVG